MAEEELRALRAERAALAAAAAAQNDELYGGAGREAYATELEVAEAEELEEDVSAGAAMARKMQSFTAPKAVLADVPRGAADQAEQAREPSATSAGQPYGQPPLTRRRARRSAPPAASPTARMSTANGG
jgi:hypothetical protein